MLPLEGIMVVSLEQAVAAPFATRQLADRWREVDSPVGPIRALVPPVTMQGVESVMEPIPEVGEHTDAILEELDLDPDAVGSLRGAGAVWGAVVEGLGRVILPVDDPAARDPGAGRGLHLAAGPRGFGSGSHPGPGSLARLRSGSSPRRSGAGMLLGMLPVGLLIDRHGERRLIVAG